VPGRKTRSGLAMHKTQSTVSFTRAPHCLDAEHEHSSIGLSNTTGHSWLVPPIVDPSLLF
jgi:hypothetical protein